MKQITENQHLSMSWTPIKDKGLDGITVDEKRFAKPGETQSKAIARMTARRRKELSSVDGSFPKFKPGMTTAEYINLFSIRRNILPYALSGLTRPAPMLDDGPEVITEYDENATD
jgi:hypothetical protein